MEKKITYIAYDGEEFNNERDCAEYELAMNVHRFKKDFSLYDECHNPIPHNMSWDNENVCYIRIINPSIGLKTYLNQRFRDYGMDSPWADYDLEFKDDLYFYDCDCCYWRSWSDEMEKLDAIGDFFQMFAEN